MSTVREELRVFVSGPDDVEVEKSLVRKVIDELNKTVAKSQGRVLVSVSAGDVYPSLGRAQETINNQLKPQESDIFIGVIWNRLGTPTGAADSGTVEEFNLAHGDNELERRPHVMYYLSQKQSPPPDNPESIEQMGRALGFKKRLQEVCFFKRFGSDDEFERTLRKDLTNYLLSMADTRSVASPTGRPIATDDNVPLHGIPKVDILRARQALGTVSLICTEIYKREESGSLGRADAIAEVRQRISEIRLRFDGEITVIGKDGRFHCHQNPSLIGRSINFSNIDFSPLLHAMNDKKDGELRWIDNLSSEMSRLHDPSVIKGCRLNTAPFVYFEPWQWFVLVEVHHQVLAEELGTEGMSLDDGWIRIQYKKTSL